MFSVASHIIHLHSSKSQGHWTEPLHRHKMLVAPMRPRKGLSPHGRAKPVFCQPPKKSCLRGGQACEDDVTLFHKKKCLFEGRGSQGFPWGSRFCSPVLTPAPCLPVPGSWGVYTYIWLYRHKATPIFFVHFLIYGGKYPCGCCLATGEVQMETGKGLCVWGY